MNKYNETIEIFDSTLRDGAQGEGINFSVDDKLNIVKTLDDFGVAFIEAGNPGSNPKDIEFFERAAKLDLKHAKLVAFGATRRKNIAAAEDDNVVSLLKAGTDVIAIFGKTSKFHVTDIINTTPQENLNMITDTVKFFAEKGKRVVFDAEHFFDGYKYDAEYALSALNAAVNGGAAVLALCDTNGGTFPDEVYDIVKRVTEMFPAVKVGIHCHNDTSAAETNSIMAVKAGARHVQGTFIGFGERCGNANLASIIPSLQLKLGYQCIPPQNMVELTAAANKVADISNIALQRFMPYVGYSAFTHKAGMHADGVLKASHSFEHIDPESVGNERRFVMSEMAGRTAVLNKLTKYFPHLNKDSAEIKSILAKIKEMEHKGYQFESAEATFLLIAYKTLGIYKPLFDLISYKTITEQPSEKNLSATAIIKIKVKDKAQLTSAQGDGPVNALDIALRQCLEVFYPQVSKISLIDYKVRVLDSNRATAARVRVLITSTDGKNRWTTVGVSTDIITASFKALTDSIEYRLLTDSKVLTNKK